MITAIRWKNSSYCVYGNFIRRKFFDDSVTLVLHSSFDRINSDIVLQIQNWNASVSLSIVLRPLNEMPLKAAANCIIAKFSEFPPSLLSFLSIHLILPVPSNKTCPILSDIQPYCSIQNTTTSSPSESLERSQPYPANTARNVGRYFIKSKFIIIADMDHYFSKNFEIKVRELAEKVIKNSPKTVLVYRIFEISTKVKRQDALTKVELKQLLQNRYAREFHSSFGHGHRIPFLKEWLTSIENYGIQFYSNYTTSEWEPQFVSTNDIPMHDETFFYPCKDNTVLRWEMCRADYNFAIMNDLFMYHKGIKPLRTKLLLDQARYSIRGKAYSALIKFKQRMKKVYPNTIDKCPSFKI
uniref:Uncharacterized protein n=1 Tax=Panagrolaimus sp. PS1159 TaxID=55785 RepID=A0AC35GDA3_9BILA